MSLARKFRRDRAGERGATRREPWRVDYADVDGCPVAYVEQGEGEPIVFLHGIGASLNYFRRNVPHFGQSMRAIAMDTPGFGASGVPDATYTVPWMAGQIARFLEVKGLGPATIVGNSMGGLLGMALALLHPARVRRLVLVNSAGISNYPRRLLIGGQRAAKRLLGSGPGRLQRWLLPPLFHATFLWVYPTRPDLGWKYARNYASMLDDPRISA
ncbi:MAG: alpha/beta fold hydrolase, partial [Myxococcota bacterium]|nr:alpha/beta fold hydrolase [Myxococcota bacterium]